MTAVEAKETSAKEAAAASMRRLIPDERVQWSDPFLIELDDLPRNEDLIGPGPDKSFLENLEALGQMEPIQVRMEGDNYRVIGGRRRIKAFRILHSRNEASGEWRYIRAVVPKNGAKGQHTATTMVALDLASNANRRDNPMSDLVGIKTLLGEFGCTPEKPTQEALQAIAKATGLQYVKLIQRLKLVALDPRLLKEAAEGRMSVALATSISKLDKDTQRELADAMEDGEPLTSKLVTEATRAGATGIAKSIQDRIAPIPERDPVTIVSVTSTMLRAALDAASGAGARRLGPGVIVLPDGGRYKVTLEVTPEQAEEAASAGGGEVVPAGGEDQGRAKPRVRKAKVQAGGNE